MNKALTHPFFVVKWCILIFILFQASISKSQDKYSVTGKVKIENGSIENTFITVYKNASKMESKLVDNSGKFSYDLDFGNDYMFEFSKEGFVTKKVSISTFVPEDVLSRDSQFPPFKFAVSLFPAYKGLDLSVFDQPMGMIMYDKELDDFDYDRDYDSQIRDAIKRAEEAARKKAAEMEAQRLAREKSYREAIQKGDINFRAKKYEEAKLAYTDALAIKAEEVYPKDQIAKIDALLAEQQRKAEEQARLAAEKKALDEKYASIIALADSQFTAKDYTAAKTSYTDALALKAEEVYPKDQIAKIDALLAEQQRKAEEQARLAAEKKALDEKYASIIALADSQFTSKDYTTAKTTYTDALALKAEEVYPKNQIVKIDALLAEQQRKAEEKARLAAEKQALDEKYNGLIAQADAQFTAKDYATAKTTYTDALALKAEETYPKDQIAKIDAVLAEQQRKAEEQARLAAEKKALDEKYNGLIVQADAQFTAKDYATAKTTYTDALALKTEEVYPKDQIAKIDALLAEQQRKAEEQTRLSAEKQALDEKYASIIALADSQFTAKEYTTSKATYTDALALKAEEVYPKDQIAKIDAVLSEQQRKAEEAKKQLAQQQLEDAKYRKLLQSGEENFELKQWSSALNDFSAASEMKPRESYPKSKIEEIKKILEEIKQKELAKNDRQSEYDEVISQADQHFANQRYDLARQKYQEARDIFPKKPYPRKQLKQIDVLLERLAIAERKEKERNRKYSAELEKAEKMFQMEKFNVARHYYESALEIKPDEAYPKEQIAEIAKRIEALKQAEEKSVLKNPVNFERKLSIKKEKEYAALVAKADQSFDAAHYNVAKVMYNRALNLFDREYPKKKLAEIKKIAQQSKNKVLSKEYQELISKADQELADQHYSVAKFYYKKAISVDAEEKYPHNQIQKIEQLIDAKKNAKIDKEYHSMISKADEALNKGNLTVARFYYRKALNLKKENYPKEKLKMIQSKLNKK